MLEQVTAAKMNEISTGLTDLDRRTTTTGAGVFATQSTTSTSYTDLATVGPTVTAIVGAVGKALVSLYSALSNASANFALTSWQAVASTTTFASDEWSLQYNGTSDIRMGGTIMYLSGTAIAESTTFTMKYRATGGTAAFNARRLLVCPLGA